MEPDRQMLPITWWPSHCYLKSFEAGNLKLLSVPLSHLSCWVVQPFLLQFPLTLQSIQTGTRRRESRTTQSPRKIAQIVFQHCHRGNFRAWRSGGVVFFTYFKRVCPKYHKKVISWWLWQITQGECWMAFTGFTLFWMECGPGSCNTMLWDCRSPEAEASSH